MLCTNTDKPYYYEKREGFWKVKADYEEHPMKKHPDNLPDGENGKKFSCSFCGQKFRKNMTWKTRTHYMLCVGEWGNEEKWSLQNLPL